MALQKRHMSIKTASLVDFFVANVLAPLDSWIRIKPEFDSFAEHPKPLRVCGVGPVITRIDKTGPAKLMFLSVELLGPYD